MALWTPAQIPTDLWLDASNSGSITIVTGVSQWNDLSGNGKNFVQATGANQPTVVSGGQNGLNILAFNGTSQFLSCSQSIQSSTGPLEIFILCKRNTTAGGTLFVDRLSYYLVAFELAYIAGNYYLRSDAISNQTFNNSTDFTNLYNLFSLVHLANNPGNVPILRTNSNLISIAGGNAVSESGTAGSLIGVREGGNGHYWSGNICEIICINSVVSVANRQFIEGYLAWKWGINASLPGGHPYYSAAPTILTTITGTDTSTQNQDTSSLACSVVISGTDTSTQIADISNATASNLSAITGTDASVSSPETCIVTSSLAIAGTEARTQNSQVESVSAAVQISGSSSVSQTPNVCAAGGALTLLATCADQNINASSAIGAVLDSGSVARTQAINSCAATASNLFYFQGASTQSTEVSVVSAALSITASVTNAQGLQIGNIITLNRVSCVASSLQFPDIAAITAFPYVHHELMTMIADDYAPYTLIAGDV